MWKIFILEYLNERLMQLERMLLEKEKEGIDLHGNFHVKLYVSVIKAMRQVRENPKHKNYVQGNTLGESHRDWRRIKQFLPDRYRMFFKFFSADKSIFFAWLNDENTLRHDGAKTDCYAVFSDMLESGEISSDRIDLENGSASKENAVLKNE